MASTNPFVFGKVVRGKDFCNRRQEMEQIRQAARSKSNLIIVSPRRYGKTSLVINALEKYDVPFLFVDCFEVANEQEFLERLLSAYFQALRKGDVLDRLKYLSKAITIDYSFSIKGITIKVRQYQDTALRAILEEVTRQHLLVLDEFQELFVVAPDIIKKLRSTLQFLRQAFLFLGSKKHLLLYLFSDQRSPFYNFGAVMALHKISAADWQRFIEKKFADSTLSITDTEIKEVLSAAELIPFYVQYLCYYLWLDRKEGKGHSPAQLLANLLQANAHIYEELYGKLPVTQKKALQLLLPNEQQQEQRIYSAESIKKAGVGSGQALHKAFTLLVDKGFLEKNGNYFFNDPLFKRYLQGRGD